MDHDGNIYIVEDRGGGVDDDVWFARKAEPFASRLSPAFRSVEAQRG